MGATAPLGLANEPPAVRPNLEVVVKELDRFLVNVLHDDDLLALIAVPPLIVELRVVTLGSQHGGQSGSCRLLERPKSRLRAHLFGR